MSEDQTSEVDNLGFNEGYRFADVYDDMLPPHYYDGQEDIHLFVPKLRSRFGAPARSLRVLDIGCGPGRMTSALAPYAAELHGADKSAGMIEQFRTRFPQARTTCADTEMLVDQLHTFGEEGTYDLIGAFWSLSYPLLECFEETTEDGVIQVGDIHTGLHRASKIIDQLVGLLAPGGSLFLLFFDADSAEQRLVTALWERVAPFPGSGRGFTWELLRDGLMTAERGNRGQLFLERLPGAAVCRDAEAAHRWFNVGHLNSYAELVDDPEVSALVSDFVLRHQREDGSVVLPSGVHVAEFRASGAVNDPLLQVVH
jgi:SAM-dependent methyltransferase